MTQFLGNRLGLDPAVVIEWTQVIVAVERVAGTRSGVTNEIEGHW